MADSMAEWLRNYTLADTDIASIIGVNMFSEKGRIEDIPMIVYQVLPGSFSRNRILESIVYTFLGYETTRALAETLGRHIHNRYDTSVTRISDVSGVITIHSIEIVNHFDAFFDEENQKWFSSTDVKLNYYRS
jgi:hypothetical protein